MLRTMITATNTMGQLQNKLDTISNNIANSNTTGYKTKEASFNELLYQQFNNDKQDRAERQTPVGIRYGTGAMIGQIKSNEKQGSLQTTNRDLDLAFTKAKQYFNILMPNGENGTETVYTRQGDFYLSPLNNGTVMLVTAEGLPCSKRCRTSHYITRHGSKVCCSRWWCIRSILSKWKCHSYRFSCNGIPKAAINGACCWFLYGIT